MENIAVELLSGGTDFANKGVWLCEQLLHGEQYTEVFKALAASDTFISSAYIADILDKGSGAVIIINGIVLKFQTVQWASWNWYNRHRLAKKHRALWNW